MISLGLGASRAHAAFCLSVSVSISPSLCASACALSCPSLVGHLMPPARGPRALTHWFLASSHLPGPLSSICPWVHILHWDILDWEWRHFLLHIFAKDRRTERRTACPWWSRVIPRALHILPFLQQRRLSTWGENVTLGAVAHGCLGS